MIRKFLIVPNILKFSTMFEGQQNTVLKLLKKKSKTNFLDSSGTAIYRAIMAPVETALIMYLKLTVT